MLIISDPHFGKTGHFRKAGINVPQKSFQEDLLRLFEVIQYFGPRVLLINGDLFHSGYNKEIDYFFRWRNYIKDLEIILVKGNHDTFDNTLYTKEGIIVYPETYQINEFCFTHDSGTATTDSYIFSGHIHPSVRISGTGKQSLNLPCFYFGRDYAVLPAFGNFTGSVPISPIKGDTVFAITKREVIKV